jgi:hypothetical protein
LPSSAWPQPTGRGRPPSPILLTPLTLPDTPPSGERKWPYPFFFFFCCVCPLTQVPTSTSGYFFFFLLLRWHLSGRQEQQHPPHPPPSRSHPHQIPLSPVSTRRTLRNQLTLPISLSSTTSRRLSSAFQQARRHSTSITASSATAAAVRQNRTTRSHPRTIPPPIGPSRRPLPPTNPPTRLPSPNFPRTTIINIRTSSSRAFRGTSARLRWWLVLVLVPEVLLLFSITTTTTLTTTLTSILTTLIRAACLHPSPAPESRPPIRSPLLPQWQHHL